MPEEALPSAVTVDPLRTIVCLYETLRRLLGFLSLFDTVARGRSLKRERRRLGRAGRQRRRGDNSASGEGTSRHQSSS